LCIQDDEQTASVISEALHELGYEVAVARNGEEGLAAIRSEKPDLVICDVVMPDMNGFQVLERLVAAGSDHAAIPFVFLTALGDRDSELAGRRLGADDYLTKPIDFERLDVLSGSQRIALGPSRPRGHDFHFAPKKESRKGPIQKKIGGKNQSL
jgi:DNA-binding response OmpR family regulator